MKNYKYYFNFINLQKSLMYCIQFYLFCSECPERNENSYNLFPVYESRNTYMYICYSFIPDTLLHIIRDDFSKLFWKKINKLNVI